MRTVNGPTDPVVVVGAGLGGLACAIRLAAAGRTVTVIERNSSPGGRVGQFTAEGYTFDLGPTVLTAPELIDELLATVGEKRSDWLELTRLDPAYRAHFPDGSSLDVIADTARMAAEVSRVCGPNEADRYLRFAEHARRLWQLERADFIERNLDSPLDLVTASLLRLALAGGFRRLQPQINSFFRDPRTRRVFSFQALYAGLAPQQALALYTVITYLDSISGVYHPRGGLAALPKALAAVAQKAGVTLRYGTAVERVEIHGERATGVITAQGERFPAEVVVLNPDRPTAERDLLPGHARSAPPSWLGRRRYSPSCAILHVGSTKRYSRIAHHNVHFGRSWGKAFDEVIDRGRLMSDPSLFVTNPTRIDPGLAPPDRDTYYVLAPTPNLTPHRRNTPVLDWNSGLSGAYRTELIRVLERRGYVDFGDGIEVSRFVTPVDWQAAGLAGGTPFSLAHTLRQTGPFRPGTLHPTLANVVFVGSGTQPGVGVPMVLVSGRIAAERITGVAR